MAGRDPEERVERPAVRQSWRRVTFVHWRVEPRFLLPLLPCGLEPDVFDGSGWVTLTPFVVEGARILRAPPVPFLSTFPETNVRTYVRGPDGRDGLWFLSLDVPRVSNVVGGRGVGAPYQLASMSVTEERGAIRYRSRRLLGRRASHDIVAEPGTPVADDEVGELAHLLTGRWRAYTKSSGELWSVPVEHQPWPLRNARLVSMEESLLAAARVTVTGDPPLVHFSDGVDARLGPPRRAGQSM